MRLISWLLVLFIATAAIAWATRPGLDAFDAALREQLETKIATTDIGTSGDTAATIALVGCKLRPSDCFSLIRQSLDVVMEDRTFFTRFTVKGFGQDATCTGAFTRLWCSKDVLGN
ncbi:MAG: hypothetical protein WAU13_10125 [Albidovulum sp.]